MKKYKHKATGCIAVKTTYHSNYMVTGPTVSFNAPSDIIESGDDWEEVKEVMFTTDDGVDIFTTEATVYSVNTVSGYAGTTTLLNLANYKPDTNRYGWKYFSTKEARLDYMVRNMYALPLADVFAQMDLYGMAPTSSLYRLIYEAATKKLKANDSNL